MKKLSKDDTVILSRYLDNSLLQKWEGVQQRLSASKSVTIANTGLVNSGKSSLFNMLVGSINEERFPVGPIRTTKLEDREWLSEGIELVDTPGIDATEEDNEVAYQTVMSADYILFTHNIKIGMLNREEFLWLKRLAQGKGQQLLLKQFIFVCTWVDTCDRDADYNKRITELKRQIVEATGVELPFWELSAKRYRDGQNKKSDALSRKSGIPAFKKYLIEHALPDQTQMTEQRQNELRQIAQEIKKVLEEQRHTLQTKKNEHISNIERAYSFPMKAWKDILQAFVSHRKNLFSSLEKLQEEMLGSSYSPTMKACDWPEELTMGDSEFWEYVDMLKQY